MLGVNEAHCNVQLDKLVSDMTGLCLNSADMTIESKDSVIARLKNQTAELEQEVDQHKSQVQKYRKQLGDRDREVSQLRRNSYIP